MVSTVITSESTTSVNLETFDEYYLQQGVLHHVSTGSVITALSGTSNLNIFIFGDTFAPGSAVVDLGGATDIFLNVGPQGSVSGINGVFAIKGSGANFDLSNNGLITGGQIQLLGDDSQVFNTGVINGTFQGGSPIAALRLDGNNASLVNTGVINSASTSIVDFLDNASVINSGLLTGGTTGINAFFLSAPESLTVTNTGQIIVNGIAIQGGLGADKVVNSGQINGTVELGGGADSFKTTGPGFASDEIMGDGGNDTLRGGGFDDTLNGGDDDDLLRGKGGEDDLIGGTGNDTLFGGSDDDSLTGEDGDDDLRGGNGNDTLEGGGNKDLLVGGTGNDTMEGGSGNDTLRGGAGDDTIAGQNGSDEMSGGAGADIFVFTNASHSAVGNRDDILGFQKGEDRIDVDELSNDTFIFLGNGAFTASGDAELRVTTNGAGNSVVRIDTDGDGTADSEINVLGVTGLDAGDFVL